MIRMQNRNSSCDCGKTTKERGSFVAKSKVYETRSGAQRTQGDKFTEEKDDVRINSTKGGDELLFTKMEATIITVPPINKSFNFRNSTVNLSKTTTNKSCDNNIVVTNGNARSLIGDALADIKVTKELKLDILECNCVRSNMNFEESINLSNENNIPQVEDESEKELREDKQNGVYERCDGGDSDLNGRCLQKYGNVQNSTDSLTTSLEENGSDILVNGYLNGSEHVLQHNEKLDFDFVREVNIIGENCGHKVENSDINFEPNLVSDKKKRKSNFEKIFDSYAEFGCSDKRRNRRPPESYSPEPTRRIKLETLFGEKSNLTISAKVKKKTVRKPRQKGPIFHYLDLYIKNKDVEGKTIKQEVVEEQLIDPSLIKQEEIDIEEPYVEDISSHMLLQSQSPYTVPDHCSSNNIGIQKSSETFALTSNFEYSKPSEIIVKANNLEFRCPFVEKVNNNIESTHQTLEIDSTRTLPCSSRISPISHELPTDNCLVSTNSKKKTKVINNKHRKIRKEKPKQLTYDADISRILGYRRNKGKNEFLVLFHNGTSNWVIQDNNITIIPPYKDYFEHSEQELSTINRLAYFIKMNSRIEKEDNCYYETESNCDASSTSTKEQNGGNIHSPISSSALSPKGNLMVSHKGSSIVSPKGSVTVNPKGLSVISPKGFVASTKGSSMLCHKGSLMGPKLDIHTDISPVNCIKTNMNNCIKANAYCSGYNETMSKSNLNELCNYVMSSRHIKLYPFETTKEVVFKRDDEFMHIYLKNVRKNQEDLRRIDDHLNIRSCEKLIYTLEDCAVDNTCEVVVISGIEEYFALKNVFDKLLKKPATVEGKNYEQDVSMLRYLIQTIRNFTKPICAVIKKTATGLPASMLSLFDMVFDERGENFMRKSAKARLSTQKKPKEKVSKKKKNGKHFDSRTVGRGNDENVTEDFQSYLFPRLMGLTESNESQIMGEGQKLNDFDDLLSSSSYNKRILSLQLRKSLRHMKNNTKIQMKNRGRKQSLNSEEEFENIIAEENFHSSVSAQPSIVMQANIDNLEREIEREKELTKRSMDELESILHSMGPC